ncbi:hypothetical protein WA158_003081 [Blastocystis sp. Blastoise]
MLSQRKRNTYVYFGLVCATVLIILYIRSSTAHLENEHISDLATHQKMSIYTKETREWSKVNFDDLKQVKLFMRLLEINQNSYTKFQPSSMEYGLYYPLRDVRNSDLEYFHKVLYFSAQLDTQSLPRQSKYIDLEISTSTLGPKINYRIPIEMSFDISGEQLGCKKCVFSSKASHSFCSYSQTCPICSQVYKGLYIKGICKVTAYAQNICFRIKENDKFWHLDSNPSLLKNNQSQPGCDYISNQYLYDLPPWYPISYGPLLPSTINVTLRHYKDPYIVASNITAGCSSKNTNEQNCLGTMYDDLYHTLFEGFFLSVIFYLYYNILPLVFK